MIFYYASGNLCSRSPVKFCIQLYSVVPDRIAQKSYQAQNLHPQAFEPRSIEFLLPPPIASNRSEKIELIELIKIWSRSPVKSPQQIFTFSH